MLLRKRLDELEHLLAESELQKDAIDIEKIGDRHGALDLRGHVGIQTPPTGARRDSKRIVGFAAWQCGAHDEAIGRLLAGALGAQMAKTGRWQLIQTI